MRTIPNPRRITKVQSEKPNWRTKAAVLINEESTSAGYSHHDGFQFLTVLFTCVFLILQWLYNCKNATANMLRGGLFSNAINQHKLFAGNIMQIAALLIFTALKMEDAGWAQAEFTTTIRHFIIKIVQLTFHDDNWVAKTPLAPCSFYATELSTICRAKGWLQ